MNKGKVVYTATVILLAVVSVLWIWNWNIDLWGTTYSIDMNVECDKDLTLAMYYSTGKAGDVSDVAVSEEQKVTVEYKKGQEEPVSFYVPLEATYFRFDPSEEKTKEIRFSNVNVVYGGDVVESFSLSDFVENSAKGMEVTEADGAYVISTSATDGHALYEFDNSGLKEFVVEKLSFKLLVKQIVFTAMVLLLTALLLFKGNSVMEIAREAVNNKKLLWNLSKNDFKTKFAGSYLGIIWAFVQPVITVLVYWFVFEKALNAAAQSTKAGLMIPFVVWLVAGMVPWFYFSDVVNAGTNVLFEYSYLVKKVVFDIGTLPIIKAISAFFVHIAFLAFALCLSWAYGFTPSLYTLQLIYYVAALALLSLGIVYVTSAIVVFFRDLSQVVNILLQVWVWVTPIMWVYDAMAGRLSPVGRLILKANPLFYIVQGYRESLIERVWFFEHPEMTVYYWTFTLALFVLGSGLFRRLKIHFADVL